MDLLKEKKYNKNTHAKLLQFEAYAYSNLNVNPRDDFFTHLERHPSKDIQVKMLFSNVIEKYIICTELNDKTGDDLTLEELNKIYEIIFVKSPSFSNKENLLAKMLFSISHEQILFQERKVNQYINRVLGLLGNCEVSKSYLLSKTGLDLEKMVVLYWSLFSFITKDNTVKTHYSIPEFKNFVLAGIKDELINENDLDNFFKFVLTEIEELKKLYFNFRKVNSKWINYEELHNIDKYLPKVSFYAPFVKTKDEEFLLISYSGLTQFMCMEKVFYTIIEQPGNYKKNIFGPLLESYIADLVNRYIRLNNSSIQLHYYEDQRYETPDGSFHYPDLVLESDKFVIFIESKTSGFALKNALVDFSKNTFSSTISGIKKSQKNIDRFVKYNPLNIKNLETKQHYKLVSFNAVSGSMLGALRHADFIELNDVLLVDFQSFETLFSIVSDKTLNEILDEYIVSVEDVTKTNDLTTFCSSRKFIIDIDDNEIIQDKILCNYLRR